MPKRHPEQARRTHHRLEGGLLRALADLRTGLLAQLPRKRSNRVRRREHLCCRRPKNQMRISPLEARAIAVAFRTQPYLRRRLPAVLGRLSEELPQLQDNDERQSFTCPLLDGNECLVHEVAKPIGCLAWNEGKEYSEKAWRSFEQRDQLSDSLFGRNWQLRVIPLWLKRVFATELRSYKRRQPMPAVEDTTRPSSQRPEPPVHPARRSVSGQKSKPKPKPKPRNHDVTGH